MEGNASRTGPETGTVTAGLASRSSAKNRKMNEEDGGAIDSNLISKGPHGQDAACWADTNVKVKDIVSGSGGGASAVLETAVLLQDSVVLTHVFEVCPPRDLANSRLVCKEWRDLSLKAWRTSATLKFRRNAVNGRLHIECGGGTWTPLNQLMKYLRDPLNECEVKPFRRMKMYRWNFDPRSKLIERFWQLTGRHVTSLDLRYSRFSDGEEFWRITYSLCPNLTRLCLRECSFISGGQSMNNPVEPQLEYKEPLRGRHGHLKCLVISHSELPASWLELLSHFESLTSLKVKAGKTFVCESLLSAIKVIRKHSGNKLPLPIKDFHIRPFEITHDKASHNKFLLIRELNLSLNSLTIRAHPDLDLWVVSDILELYSETLGNLDLNGPKNHNGDGRWEWQFPGPVRLEKLQSLSIENMLLESTEILKSAPNLRSLYVDGEDRDLDRMKSICNTLTEGLPDNTSALLPKLTKLSYFGSFGNSGNLATLAKLMPNVEELQIDLDYDNEFSTVCEHWKGLKKLAVEIYEDDVSYHLTDLGLTGGRLQIEKPDWRWVHKAVHPNITDLKGLRSFSCLSNRLTEVSVYNGFLQLPNLRTLTLSSKYETNDDGDDDDEEDQIESSSKQYCFGEEARNDLREKGIQLNFR